MLHLETVEPSTLELLKKYLRNGYYLFYKEGINKYETKLQEALNKTIGDLTKLYNVFLNNTNLSYFFGENANIGSERETFFVNQLKAVSHVSLARQGDFKVENYTFEVGGKRNDVLSTCPTGRV